MLNFIAQTLAVPYGYTNQQTLNMEDVPDCASLVISGNNQHNIPTINISGPALPDILMDLTPPPSPLRRAHSYHFEFPVKKRHMNTPMDVENINTILDVANHKQQDTKKENGDGKDQNIRTVADDLKRIADKFHLDHAKFHGKSRANKVDTLDVVIPVVATRCLQAGLVTLLCWRLLNKLR